MRSSTRSWGHALATLLFLAALVWPAALSAQVGTGRLTGVVRDASNGQPMVGVQIELEGTGMRQITDENGRYFFINVPAGTYTVVVNYLGYATVRRENVLVAIDQGRTQDFDLTTQAIAVQEVLVEAERVPLVELGNTGSRDIITADEIQALPVSSVQELLGLQHGFFEVPLTPDLVSFLDSERGITPLHIRGGRMGENITMVDGIPVTNFIMGNDGFSPSTIAIEQTDYSRGGFEAKYGNALSGVVNIRTREPREFFQGSISFQSSAFGGMLGSKYDELRAAHQLDGFISGPIPGTGNKLMFVVTGSNTQDAGRALEFDDHIYVPTVDNSANLLDTARVLYASEYDLIPGWRAMGYSRSRDVMGKLQYRYSPFAKLTFQVTDSESQSQGYAFNAQRIGWDLHGECVARYPTLSDVCGRFFLNGIDPVDMRDLYQTRQANQWTGRNSVSSTSRLYTANWDHTVPHLRLAYNLAWGRNEQYRDTCTFAAAFCFGERLGWLTTSGPFIMNGGDRNTSAGNPIFGTATTAGGDRSTSEYFRGDLEWQATDNHNISTGFFLQRHDIFFREARQIGNFASDILPTEYGGGPWDGALYIQDRIEYDFMTLNLGLRFDYGRASGKFFNNPRDPTNGTTAYNVCTDPVAFGLPANHFTHYDEISGNTVTGFTACSLNEQLMEQAVLKAMEDDFREAKPRRSLSPRLGISFPVTENSSVFFNYGRFTQNPRYHNLYRLTGIGTEVEGTRDVFSRNAGGSRRAQLVGNAHLLSEQTSNYELGYISSFGDGLYGFNATIYVKDQYNLTGSRQGGVDDFGQIIFDPGSTYRSTTLNYIVLLNLDFQSARGLELTLRRRLENYWGFDLRYAYSQVRTNAAPAELELQRQLDEGDAVVRREIRSYIDRPHVATLALRFQIDRNTPDIPFGELLRNTQLSFTGRYSSGTPYTPQLGLSGSQSASSTERLLRNSATAPSTVIVNALARKSFRHANLDWAAFIRVDNIFNTRNCVQVYPSTGRCDGGALTAARLADAGDGQGQGSSISATNYTSQAWDRPDYYSPPRAISAGLQVTF